jgi:aminoglycoside 3'-phosphotransferase-2
MADPDNPAVPRSLHLQHWTELANARIEPVTEGMSGALLFRVTEQYQPVRYLKIARDDAIPALRREIERTRWLAEQGVSVPPIRRIEEKSGQLVMLTQAVPGLPAEMSTLPPARLIPALARGLATLHQLPPASCPFDESLRVRLSNAAKAVASGEVDTEAFEPRNRGMAPEALLARLTENQPEQDIVVVHGDTTLTNLIVDGEGNLGFVDAGNAGRGDRYIDLAVLHGEIEENFGPEAAGHFIRAYGLCSWNASKARYFSDLYELF